MATFTHRITVDLQEKPNVFYIGSMFYEGDALADTIEVTVLDGGEAASITGSVSGKVVTADGGTVAATGSLSGNVASLALPASAYLVTGNIKITVTLVSGSETTTLVGLVATVMDTETGTIIDPGTIIPSVTQLIADIEDAVATIPADYSDLQSAVSTLQTRVTNQATAINTINANEIKEEMVTRTFTVDVDTATTTYIPLDLYCISGKEVVVTVSGVSISGENSMRLYHGDGQLDTETTIILPSTVTTATIDCVCSPAATGGELHINFTGTGTATVAVRFYPGLNYILAEIDRISNSLSEIMP